MIEDWKSMAECYMHLLSSDRSSTLIPMQQCMLFCGKCTGCVSALESIYCIPILGTVDGTVLDGIDNHVYSLGWLS